MKRSLIRRCLHIARNAREVGSNALPGSASAESVPRPAGEARIADQTRALPAEPCSNCHRNFFPLGYALENQSSAPESGAFDPKQIAPQGVAVSRSLREEHLPDGKEFLIFALPFADRTGNQYVIETGAPYEQVERVLRGLLVSLGVAFPLIVGAAVGGGYVLMRNALRPRDEIATTAEQITSRNLNERLPVVPLEKK